MKIYIHSYACTFLRILADFPFMLVGAQFQQRWGFGQVCIKETSDDIINLFVFQYNICICV